MKKLSPKQKIYHIRYLKKLNRKKNKQSKHKRKKSNRTKEDTFAKKTLQHIGKQGFTSAPLFQPLVSHEYHIKIPKVFSLIDNYDESLMILEKIAQAVRDKFIKKLFLDHSLCEVMDLGASTVLDVLVMPLKRNWRTKKVIFGGAYPQNAEVAELLKITGIIKHYDHPDSNVSEIVKKKYKLFQLVCGRRTRRANAHKSTQAEIITTKLTNFFNELLETKGFILTPEGLNNFSRLISEVIDNAEQHSGNEEWFIIGYMNHLGEGIDSCNICIFDFGKPITQSLRDADLNEHIKIGIETLITKHLTKGFFGSNNKWTEDNLWTLYALQEGISRFNVRNKTTDRGHGTVNMIEFFLELGKHSNENIPPKMALLSGNTYILFDGKYTLGNIVVGNETRQVIAFNNENSLEDKPDEKYVKKMENYFPGTMITMQFFLDPKYLQSVKSGEIHNGNKNH
jgi:hypothetical protein